MAISNDHCNAQHSIYNIHTYEFVFAYTIDAFQLTYHHCGILCKLVSSNNIKGGKKWLPNKKCQRLVLFQFS